MSDIDLQPIVEAVQRRAAQQGHVTPHEVRELLAQAGHDESLWKDVLTRTQPKLRSRAGRYYPPAVSERARREQDQQQAIVRAIRRIVRQYKAATQQDDRREQARISFIQPVKVRGEDGRETTLLSRDISATGIRLFGTRRLLGQKIRVFIPQPGSSAMTPNPGGWGFVVRVLWTLAIGDDLFENGGTFIEVEETNANLS